MRKVICQKRKATTSPVRAYRKPIWTDLTAAVVDPRKTDTLVFNYILYVYVKTVQFLADRKAKPISRLLLSRKCPFVRPCVCDTGDPWPDA